MQVFAHLRIEQQRLSLSFEVQGPGVGEILFPENRLKSAARKDFLWQHTCFEAFLALSDSPSYWEFNLSPSGDWNIYRFHDYRQGQSEELRIRSVHVLKSAQLQSDRFVFEAEVNLAPIRAELNCTTALVGLTCVIETIDHKKSYWAIQHCGSQPDFHLRESFLLKESSSIL